MRPTCICTEFILPFQKEDLVHNEIFHQSKDKIWNANSKLCTLKSEVRGFSCLSPSRFASCSTLFSLGLIPLPVCSSPCTTSHGFSIYSVLRSPTQLGLLFQFHTMACLGSTAKHLASAAFLHHGKRSHNP